MDVDCAVYVRGVRQQDAVSLAEARAAPLYGGSFVWIDVYEPSSELMNELREEFHLHELAVEDVVRAHQRPKVEGYDSFHLVVFKTARLDAETNRVSFGELDILVGPGFVITVRHGGAHDPGRARARVEAHPELLKTGPASVVWALLDVVVDDYGPVVEAIEAEVEEIEQAVFADGRDLTERVYLAKQQINEVYRAIHPLLTPLEAIQRGAFPEMDPALARYFRDVADHVRRVQDEVTAEREQLVSVLEANLSLINVRQNVITAQQNQIVKQLTIVATVFLPLTFVTGFFGQNFAWLERHIDSLAMFVLLGLGGLVVPCLLLYAWFRQGGYLKPEGET